ncbi:MAG: exodeoxyribonuclease VII small subunit [Oscillospiraceae bacterium]|nr:exodeoxyribonuclease VII small subunit [Oscillospiraceae bacterium]MDD6084951.1 exodeoxyribonuclease VII small subunit [Oscillospiraceae bacterium]MDY3256993.1 exodeoxyribonuclease VII small subunit [Ruminococcus callidus]
MSIEEEIKELEEITNKLENTTLSLDESLKLYKKGTEISGSIKKRIENAKLQVNYIESEE